MDIKSIEKIYKNAVRSSTSYTGNTRKGDKVISASSIVDDDLRLVLKIRNGVDNGWEYEQNTLGSVFHLGMDKVFSDPNLKAISAYRMTIDIGNKWKLSGELDLLVETVDNDGKPHYWIVDHKLCKYGEVARLDKDGKYHGYSIQQRVYKFLLMQTEPEKYTSDNISMALALNFKDGSYHTKEQYPNFMMYHIKDRLTDDELTDIIKDKCIRIDEYIERESMPDQCEKLLWSRYYGGREKSSPMRCIKFCDVSSVCPYNKFKDKSISKKNNDLINSLLL